MSPDRGAPPDKRPRQENSMTYDATTVSSAGQGGSRSDT
jgi:hypothetical protein